MSASHHWAKDSPRGNGRRQRKEATVWWQAIVSFLDFILRNLWFKKARSIGLAFAVAITLDVTSTGLEKSAVAIISVGKADFTVAQKGASDTLSSRYSKLRWSWQQNGR